MSDGTPTSVYKYFDKCNVLIYVGITNRGIQRNREHNGTKDWWPFVVSQQVEHLPSREEALAREEALIRKHRPPFNVQHNPGHAELRRLYLICAALPAKSKEVQQLAVSKAARQQVTMLSHRLPLRLDRKTATHAVYRTRPEHLALAQAILLEERTILRAPTKIGTLIATKQRAKEFLYVFECAADAKVPAAATLKLRYRKNPLTIWAVEAVAA